MTKPISPSGDPELDAMVTVVNALTGLEAEAVARVLQYVTRRLGPQYASSTVAVREPGPAQGGGVPYTYEDLPSLFDAAHPTSGTMKALAVGYYYQILQGQEDFEAFAVNKDLKNLGHPSTNITRDLDGLIQRRLVMQTRKQGNSRQARKKYKLTREGAKMVERMLNHELTDEEMI